MTDSFGFEYELPKRLIAQHPLRNRADARLMLIDRQRGSIDHFHVRDLPSILLEGDRVVLNDTRVIPAHLEGFRTATGGRWEGLFLEARPDGSWNLLCKTRGRLQAGEAITLVDRDRRPVEKLHLVEREEGGQWLARPESEIPALDLLARIGRVPLPPYIRGGHMVDADVEDYQTVFARRAGSVAAPTAGLHFTGPLLRSLERRGVQFTAVTLHVGLGTFQPIQTESLAEHRMHSELGEVSAAAADQINQSREAGGRAVAVGTTVVRVLETAARAPGTSGEGKATPAGVQPWQGSTNLFIRPPFEFRAVDALLTNFHFPRTTLLVLVQQFGGRELIRRAYEEAIREEYRFYSYGDAMLIV